jgi:hypothetical protein
MILKHWIYLLTTLLLFSCAAEEKQDNSESSDKKQEVVPVDTLNTADEAEPVILENKIEITGDVMILRPGEFHGDEILDGAENLEWIGLFEMKAGGFVWKSTNISIEPIKDVCIDDDDQMTGKRVSCNDMGAYALFTGITGFSGEFLPLSIPKNQLFPNDVLELGTFTLQAVGQVQPGKESTDPSAITDYKLMAKYGEGADAVSTVIAHAAFFDDAMITILMAADLDGDGLTDYIIDTSYKYSFSNVQIFLSSQAVDKQLLKSIGTLRKTAC